MRRAPTLERRHAVRLRVFLERVHDLANALHLLDYAQQLIHFRLQNGTTEPHATTCGLDLDRMWTRDHASKLRSHPLDQDHIVDRATSHCTTHPCGGSHNPVREISSSRAGCISADIHDVCDLVAHTRPPSSSTVGT